MSYCKEIKKLIKKRKSDKQFVVYYKHMQLVDRLKMKAFNNNQK